MHVSVTAMDLKRIKHMVFQHIKVLNSLHCYTFREDIQSTMTRTIQGTPNHDNQDVSVLMVNRGVRVGHILRATNKL